MTGKSLRPGGGVKSEKAFELSDELVTAAKKAAALYGVSSAVCEEDQLLGFLVNNRSDSVEAVEVYINDGDAHARQISGLIDFLRLPESAKVLEFASGFGRITRHLVELHSKIDLVACDIHEDACVFLEEELGITAVASSSEPEHLNVGNGFDLIFAVSFFSHLPEKNFGRWLKALYDCLAPGGHLMFTTHGESAVSLNPEFWNSMPEGPSRGHRFLPHSDQLDLDQSNYGTSLALPVFVMKMMREFIPGAQMIRSLKGQWFQIQDEWIIQKQR